MNRQQRRAKDRVDRQTRKRLWPSGFVETDALPVGTRFTIQGVRRLENGEIISDCKDGKETVFVSQAPAPVRSDLSQP